MSFYSLVFKLVDQSYLAPPQDRSSQRVFWCWRYLAISRYQHIHGIEFVSIGDVKGAESRTAKADIGNLPADFNGLNELSPWVVHQYTRFIRNVDIALLVHGHAVTDFGHKQRTIRK